MHYTQTFETFDYELYLGEGSRERCFSAHNTIQARDTGRDDEDTLVFYYKDDTSADPPNIGVRNFTRAGASSMYQRGPILVIREGYRSGPRGLIEEHRDLDMRDVRSAADYFSSAWRRGLQDSQLCDVRVLTSGIACAKDVSQWNLREKWQERIMNGCDSIFQSEGSGIANLLGIPLTLRVTEPNGKHRDEQDGSCYNASAEHLMRDITSTKTGPQGDTRHMRRFRRRDRAYAGTDGFGSSPEYWSSITTGSVWIARADGLPLPAQHLEALCSYITNQVEPRLFSCISGLSPSASASQRERVLNTINKADFMEFFSGLRASRGATDITWRGLPSPYELTPGIVDELRPMLEEKWELQKSRGMLQQSELPRQPQNSVASLAQFFSNFRT